MADTLKQFNPPSESRHSNDTSQVASICSPSWGQLSELVHPDMHAVPPNNSRHAPDQPCATTQWSYMPVAEAKTQFSSLKQRSQHGQERNPQSRCSLVAEPRTILHQHVWCVCHHLWPKFGQDSGNVASTNHASGNLRRKPLIGVTIAMLSQNSCVTLGWHPSQTSWLSMNMLLQSSRAKPETNPTLSQSNYQIICPLSCRRQLLNRHVFWYCTLMYP